MTPEEFKTKYIELFNYYDVLTDLKVIRVYEYPSLYIAETSITNWFKYRYIHMELKTGDSLRAQTIEKAYKEVLQRVSDHINKSS